MTREIPRTAKAAKNTSVSKNSVVDQHSFLVAFSCIIFVPLLSLCSILELTRAVTMTKKIYLPIPSHQAAHAIKRFIDDESEKDPIGPEPSINPLAVYHQYGVHTRPQRYVKVRGTKPIHGRIVRDDIVLHVRQRLWDPNAIGLRLHIKPREIGCEVIVGYTSPVETALFSFCKVASLVAALISWHAWYRMAETFPLFCAATIWFASWPFAAWAWERWQRRDQLQRLEHHFERFLTRVHSYTH